MLFAPGYAESFSFWKVFIPATTSAEVKMSSIGDGFFLLLQYDEIVGSTVVLLLATIISIHAKETRSLDQWIQFFVIWVLLLATTGFAGGAVALIWLRDEIAINRASLNTKKIA